ncbi:hypothetical protein N7455_005920 [Penicillium solitum]|uniref:uncharacterized protein n=1 Tax=Penicillium solitum TaxID=60172 RepID=UPI0032C3EAC6|nr:hypothetical protein N7455_005920 [Penicillium solitum]
MAKSKLQHNKLDQLSRESWTSGTISFPSFSGLALVESMTRLSAERTLLIFASIQSGPRGSLRHTWLP